MVIKIGGIETRESKGEILPDVVPRRGRGKLFPLVFV